MVAACAAPARRRVRAVLTASAIPALRPSDLDDIPIPFGSMTL
jgi:hypothetical protein